MGKRLTYCPSYVIADYERRNFSISQCTWAPNAQQHVVPINSLTESPPPPSPKAHKLSGGAIAGIIIGSITGFLALSLLAYFFIWRKLFRKHAHTPSKDDESKGEVDSSDASSPKMPEMTGNNKQPKHEIDGSPHLGLELDGKRLPGHELGGSKVEHELNGTKTEHELESGQVGAAEMPAREGPAAEMP